jgi:ABC-2 type transport system ATP-binding protein
MKNVVEIRGLVKEYKNVVAVNGLDLTVAQGKIFGFLGQNGSGKTTTLRMMTALAKPTHGTIDICGERVRFGENKCGKYIGFLPDVPQFYDWMTPREYLTLCGNLLSMENEDLKNRINETLSLVGLDEVNRRIKGFSRGMKQRLGIAQALIHRPKLILLDEPTSALDPIGRKEVLDIIKALSGDITVFFSTHILSDVERICDTIGILHKGKLVLSGSLDEIKAGYSSQTITLQIGDNSRHIEVFAALKELMAIKTVEALDVGKYKIISRDIQEVRAKICPLLSGMNVPLMRFEESETTLEDAFVEVVGI